MEGINLPTPAAQSAAQATATVAAPGQNTAAKASGGKAGGTNVTHHSSMDVDRNTGRVVGRVVDTKTGEVVSQIPSKEMLRLLARTREMLGHLFDEKA